MHYFAADAVILGMSIGFALLVATLAYVISVSSQTVMVVCERITSGANSFTIHVL